MTAFVVVCAAMVAAALLWLVVPFLRARPADAQQASRRDRYTGTAVMVLLVPLMAAGMYAGLSNWDWDEVRATTERNAEMDELLAKLEARLQSDPEDLQGWLLLGRSYTSMQRLPQAIQAFERAYALSHGENVEAMLGLGEALAIRDESTLSGRAGALFDEALAKAPNHPKALWYGSIAALQSGDLSKGRDRLQRLLAQNPPDELRTVLERQIQDLNDQLGETQPPAADDAAAVRARAVRVAVTIAPAVKAQLPSPLPLFVLARDPAGGPPLAVQRHSSEQIPLTIELTERDAMVASRNLSSVSRVQVVARLSRSGTPQAQSGDFYGQVDYEFGKDSGTVNVVIDQAVP